MYAVLVLSVGKLADEVLVPTSALSRRLSDDGSEQYAVFVVNGGVAERRGVELLGSSGSRTAVRGIEPGITVVSFGHEALRELHPVQVVDP
jgi:hypothetical protein